MIMKPKQATHCNNFVVFLLLCSYYVTDMIQKLKLRLLVVVISFKIEFEHAQLKVLHQPLTSLNKEFARFWDASPLEIKQKYCFFFKNTQKSRTRCPPFT